VPEGAHTGHEGSLLLRGLLQPTSWSQLGDFKGLASARSSTASTSETTSPDDGVSAFDLGLSPDEEASLVALEQRLAAQPEPHIAAHDRENTRQRLVRWLDAARFDVEDAFNRLHDHAAWWKAYGLDNFSSDDEFDTCGPLSACGEDRQGKPTMVARPGMHLPENKEDSLRAARRCVYTMQRGIERLSPQQGSSLILIFDCQGVQRRNCDLTFARELIPIFDKQFPGRLERVLIINNHWTMRFFWVAISALLPADVKKKIRFCGRGFREDLLDFIREDHPYMQYALQVQEQPLGCVPLPPRLPYEPKYVEAGPHGSAARSLEQIKPALAGSCRSSDRKSRGEGSCCW